MNDHRQFGFPSDDLSPESWRVNRILRFEAGTESVASDEIVESRFVTQLDGIETPHRICLPDGYVSSYSYPLIVWFHDDSADEDEVADILPRISERNYIGLALRGNMPREIGHGWSTSEARWSKLADDLDQLIAAMEERHLVHADRMYLAGSGAGGSLAWEVLLRQPARWAGAICLAGKFPQFPHPLANFRQLQQRRLLLSTGLDSPAAAVNDLINSGRLMYSAGMQVGTRMYDAGHSAPSDKMLRDVDHWVMDSIATAIR